MARPWAGELPNILGFPYNISATARASDFKFGTHLEFAKAHDETTRRRKGRHGPALGVLPQNLRVPFDIYTMADASDFKIGAQLGFAKTHQKNHTQIKSRRSLDLGKLPNICRSPSIFLQRPRCPLSVSGASCLNSNSQLYLFHSSFSVIFDLKLFKFNAVNTSVRQTVSHIHSLISKCKLSDIQSASSLKHILHV